MLDKITDNDLSQFLEFLITEEKSPATREKYLRDIHAFRSWLGNIPLTKIAVLDYKQHLIERYATNSVNSMLSSLNAFFTYQERFDLRVKALRVQHQLFTDQKRELTKAEYERLLKAAKRRKNQRLYYLMQTLCSTGIRVSELRFITVEALEQRQATICCKGKTRMVFLPKQLVKLLRGYAARQKIKSGPVFISKNEKPLDRSNIWADMKKLCATAGVAKEKVFPHNLRHLFARTYYSLQKDVVRLADILGHSSVNTTRIYTMETGEIHRRQIQQLGLLRC